jgi:hypothetical protein
VLKDIILVAAGLVIAAGTFRGGRLVRGDLPPRNHISEAEFYDWRDASLAGVAQGSVRSGLRRSAA